MALTKSDAFIQQALASATPEVRAAADAVTTLGGIEAATKDPVFLQNAASGMYGSQWQELVNDPLALAGMQTGTIISYDKDPGIGAFIAPIGTAAIGAGLGYGFASLLGWTGTLKTLASSAVSNLWQGFTRAPAALPAAPYVPAANAPSALREGNLFNFDNFNLGETLMGLTNAALNYRLQRQQSAQVAGPLALPGGVPTMMPGAQQVAWPSLPALGSMIGGGARAVGGAITVAGNVVRSAAGRIVGFIVGGRRISRAKGVALAKRVGLDAAAAALGVSAVELAQAVLEETGKTRRGGGVSAAQMKTTRRTIGKIERLHRQIVSACGAARVPQRRRAVACPPRRR